ncbi:MAG: cytochrome c, partial [Candidatus Eremiobacteraeota bacterium]|nr:cytochrome c [Candidatus Eremiobacteraeota bacterium]
MVRSIGSNAMQRFSVIVSTVLMAGVLGALAFAHAAGATDPYAAGDQAQGAKLVQSSACEGCHGAGLIGGGAAPKLVGIEKRLTPEQIADRIKNPKPPMPSLGFKEKQLANIVAYLSNLDGGWGAPVVKIEPARPSSDATVLVTFSGTPPKDVQV